MNLKIIQITETELQTILAETLRSELLKLVPNEQKQREYLTRQQTSIKLQLSLGTLHTYTKTGLIPAYRIAGKVRYKSNEIEQALIKIQTGSLK